MFPFQFNLGGPAGPFIETYRAYPISFLHGKEDKEKGDKVILPASAFEKLARMTVTYPMQFELRNDAFEDPRRTHVGVLEFTAPEGHCYVPYWILQNLLLPEGSLLTVTNVSLPVATFVKFRPRSVDFLDISNPKAVLESSLRNFSCLTQDDQICLPYNGKNYFIDIVELKPAKAVSIVEADVNVDFDPPVGYVEPTRPSKDAQPQKPGSAHSSPSLGPASSPAAAAAAHAAGTKLGERAATAPPKVNSMAELTKAREERKKQLEDASASYTAFSGSGRRVDGKVKTSPLAKAQTEPLPVAATAASAGQSKWKQRTKGTAFQGEGNSMSG